jgi:hypothetical protein
VDLTPDRKYAGAPDPLVPKVPALRYVPDDETMTGLEWIMLALGSGLIVVDMSQTFSFTSRGVHEENFLLPDHPSRPLLRAVLVGSLTLYWTGTMVLHRPWRTMWQTAYVGLETNAVIGNEVRVHSGYAFPW